MRSPCTTMKSSPRSLQLEKACAQPRRPNAAKKERERERERQTDRERRKEGRKETKKGKKEERKKKKEREIPVFPDQGSNPCPRQWKHGVLATGLPGKPLFDFNKIFIFTQVFTLQICSIAIWSFCVLVFVVGGFWGFLFLFYFFECVESHILHKVILFAYEHCLHF